MPNTIFLGVLDEKIKIVDEIEQCTWTDNKLGGYPIFSPSFEVENLLKNDQLLCKNCLQDMAFILQIYSPIGFDSDDRVFYFFCCLNPKCNDRKLALFRVLTKPIQESKPKTDLVFEDDWSCLDEKKKESPDNEASLNDPDKINKVKKYSHFTPHYLSVIEEPYEEFINKEKYERMANKKLIEIEVGEKYEKHFPNAFKDEKDNYKFYKQLRRCPGQLLRYEWSGLPLRPSKKCHVSPTACGCCGFDRTFEFQFMPSLINILWKNRKDTNQDMKLDFETILVYTCFRNCENPTTKLCEEETYLFKEEFVIPKPK